jgi:hypothetical protein
VGIFQARPVWIYTQSNITNKYSDVFEEDIGLLKTTKANFKLNLKENGQPKFCKVRQVPYAE